MLTQMLTYSSKIFLVFCLGSLSKFTQTLLKYLIFGDEKIHIYFPQVMTLCSKQYWKINLLCLKKKKLWLFRYSQINSIFRRMYLFSGGKKHRWRNNQAKGRRLNFLFTNLNNKEGSNLDCNQAFSWNEVVHYP